MGCLNGGLLRGYRSFSLTTEASVCAGLRGSFSCSSNFYNGVPESPLSAHCPHHPP